LDRERSIGLSRKGQFQIYYRMGRPLGVSARLVAETTNTIYMLNPKSDRNGRTRRYGNKAARGCNVPKTLSAIPPVTTQAVALRPHSDDVIAEI